MKLDPSKICFGLSAELDTSSCSLYLQLIGRKDFAELLAERLSCEEIETLTDTIAGLLHKHLSKEEYHQLFLLDEHHQGKPSGGKMV